VLKLLLAVAACLRLERRSRATSRFGWRFL